jgi:hypothetical protein
MTEFRHKVGDALYELYTPYDDNLVPQQTISYPIVRRTGRFVYVHGRLYSTRDKLIRFSIEDLETTGRAWNRPHQMSLYTRPLPHWPLMPIVVSKPEQPALSSTGTTPASGGTLAP